MADSTTRQKSRRATRRGDSGVFQPETSKVRLRFEPAAFQRALLAWYDVARRDLPWRAKPGEQPDPYRVWLSEIMLQQTTVKAVLGYYRRFIERWPDAASLGAAPRDEVLAAWAGLGYYSRARNLHACAQALAKDGFPRAEKDLRRLPGIGAYTAAAIAAIAFGEQAAVVDGNVERVIARIFALETPLPAAKPAIRSLAAALTPKERAGDYAQAMMDLGATICTPRSPSCLVCAVRDFCDAASRGDPQLFPRKRAKAERPMRTGTAFVLLSRKDGQLCVLLRRRADKGLLGGMMEPPGTEWVAAGDLLKNGEFFSLRNLAWVEAGTVRHTFTHFYLELRVAAAHCEDGSTAEVEFGGQWAPLAEIEKFALPSVMRKAIAAGVLALNAAARKN